VSTKRRIPQFNAHLLAAHVAMVDHASGKKGRIGYPYVT
jgi:hypothetical protein